MPRSRSSSSTPTRIRTAPRRVRSKRSRRYPYYAIYPDPDQMPIRRALATYTGQPVERILCGNGSDEIIDLLMRLFIEPGDAVVECPPTFGMYAFNTGVVAGRSVAVPRNADFRIDVEEVAEAVDSASGQTGLPALAQQSRRLAAATTRA